MPLGDGGAIHRRRVVQVGRDALGGDVERTQQISNQFPTVDWVRVLGRYARRANPLLGEQTGSPRESSSSPTVRNQW